ncbi:hypothetical protein [Micromonospora sp. URMC 103]|uniref:hypothetical protein n=1 Tax=Micromonospora sp. URMC 103 TaxID=3423406 RepID=UPI003F1CCAC6
MTGHLTAAEGSTSVLDVVAGDRLLPVVVLDDAAAAPPLGAALVVGGLRTIEVTLRTNCLEILDRVGGGHSFASGLIYGLMEREDLRAGVEFDAAHGALAMNTPGDTSMASLPEVEALAAGSGARVRR